MPVYAVAPSMCSRHEPPQDLFPIRSPLVVADFLLSHVRGKAFIEIGTRSGDVMACLSHYAGSATAVERAENYCKKLRERNLTVLCKDVETFTARTWPAGDVYYWWPDDAGGQSELWLQMTARAMRAQQRTGASVFIGFDAWWKPDMDNLRRLLRLYAPSPNLRAALSVG
jgi:hypothetical protein